MKKTAVGVIVLLILFLFCGCDALTSNTEELLRPPELTGEFKPINEALKSSVKGDITLKYPSTGEYRSSVILRDTDGDGVKEAFVFYGTSEKEQTSMNISLIRQVGGKWRVIDSQTITGSGVDKIDFCDMDGDGKEEILVGWEIYASSEKQLAVYSLTDKSLVQRMLEQYTTFTCCDLDENSEQEVLLQYLDVTASKNTASLIRLDVNGILKIGSCVMDGNVKAVKEPQLSVLSNGRPAIYFDEIKGIGAVTEVLFYMKGELVNPLLDSEARENKLTLRDSAIMSEDINNDGIIEIPAASSIANADISGSEKIFYTDWCAYNGETLTKMKVSIVNTVDGYRLDIPEKWVNNIAVFKDNDSKLRIIYEYDSISGEIGERLLTVKKVSPSDYKNSKGINKKTAIKLFENSSAVYIAFIPDGYSGKLAINESELKEMFVLMQFE